MRNREDHQVLEVLEDERVSAWLDHPIEIRSMRKQTSNSEAM